jgi:hypothetical protein
MYPQNMRKNFVHTPPSIPLKTDYPPVPFQTPVPHYSTTLLRALYTSLLPLHASPKRSRCRDCCDTTGEILDRLRTLSVHHSQIIVVGSVRLTLNRLPPIIVVGSVRLTLNRLPPHNRLLPLQSTRSSNLTCGTVHRTEVLRTRSR